MHKGLSHSYYTTLMILKQKRPGAGVFATRDLKLKDRFSNLRQAQEVPLGLSGFSLPHTETV